MLCEGKSSTLSVERIYNSHTNEFPIGSFFNQRFLPFFFEKTRHDRFPDKRDSRERTQVKNMSRLDENSVLKVCQFQAHVASEIEIMLIHEWDARYGRMHGFSQPRRRDESDIGGNPLDFRAPRSRVNHIVSRYAYVHFIEIEPNEVTPGLGVSYRLISDISSSLFTYCLRLTDYRLPRRRRIRNHRS